MLKMKSPIVWIRARGWWLAVFVAALPLVLAACTNGGGSGY
jgi:hypothetical protein